MTDAWGFVPVIGRGSLPFALVHGESLVAAAAFALEAAGVELLDPHLPWSQVQSSGWALALHDPLCPLTPVDFLAEVVERAHQRAVIVVGHRPVTDTVKEYSVTAGVGMLGETIDRSGLIEVTSPIVLPPAVLAALPDLPTGDFASLVDNLRRWPMEFVEAPAVGRRVHADDDIAVLEALDAH